MHNKSVVITLRAVLHYKNASFPVAGRFVLRNRFVFLLPIVQFTVGDYFCYVCFCSIIAAAAATAEPCELPPCYVPPPTDPW